ncbi:MAG TPA: Hpt domain-containing protein [Pedococcus sp.]|jgi:HPt (histidine-containing phosphotransfer) domain-containing protein|nr:Hpt domain-containing protein [Pedococcus sp.]
MAAGPGPDGTAIEAAPDGEADQRALAAERAMAGAMAGFRDRARATNLARVEVIADALIAMREGALDDDLRVGARSAAHSLAGSAGTFGFAEASELGRALETLLGAVDDPEAPAVRAEGGEQLVARLRVALADPEKADRGKADPGVDGPATEAGEGSA